MKRNLAGVKWVHSDEGLLTVINRVEARLGHNLIDPNSHDEDCRCQKCWELYQAAWVNQTI